MNKMNKTKYRILSAFVLMGAISGCANMIGTGSSQELGPVSTGPTIKELKSSPCACTEIPMRFDSLKSV